MSALAAATTEPGWFSLPPELEAREPAEERGLQRDGVRLMVADAAGGEVTHARFWELPEYLRPGDLLVVNVSATLPAACPATRADGSAVMAHFSTRVPGRGPRWRVVELRSADGAAPRRGRVGERVTLGDGAGSIVLVAAYHAGARLYLARYDGPGDLDGYLSYAGRPIVYGHMDRARSLHTYQNVFASVPGSAEMASAGRPFTRGLITRLVANGVMVAPILLHCGVSSPERHEPPFPEQYAVPEHAARLVTATRAWGGRVIAVGTTVVRALESAAADDGTVHAAGGWTDLVVAPPFVPRAVDGLITGWHEPEASHLLMLEALAGADLLRRCYREALAVGYLWHEFGDSHLILAERAGR